mgnify:CR=1 FL=1
MAIRKSSNSGIPFGGTSGRPANPVNGQPYFNGDIGRLELYTSATGWQNIVQETPGVASATGIYNESAGSGTFIISGTNFVSGAIAYAIGTNGIEYQASSTIYNSLVQLTVTFSNLSTAYEPYDIKITNPSNLFGLLPDAFYINDSPVWSTSPGSLGSYASGNVSIQLSATDDESNALTYSVTSGTLPNGLSLSSAGLISGTLNAPVGVYSFSVSVSDGANSLATRSFSIASTGPTVTGGTLTSDSTYYYRTFTSTNSFSTTGTLSCDILVVAGGGPGGAQVGGGGGAGGLQVFTNQSLNAASYNCEIGSGGPIGSYNSSGPITNRGSSGNNSQFGSLAASLGGGAGGAYSGHSGLNGGSGGGADGAGQTNFGTGTIGQGNNGGQGISGAWAGGGGGGAGAVGGNGSSNVGGNGGIGATSALINAMGAATSTGQLSGGNYYYAGGGGGCNTDNTAGRVGFGGLGGGANGANNNQSTVAGAINTGGGGGGSRDIHLPSPGGSGIIIVRYTKAQVGG